MPDASSETSPILSGEILRKLEQLELVTRGRSRSSQKGERLSRSRGQSVEFADYRTYSPGDDLRYLDWNLYGRLDKLFVKLYEEERELPVRILLDNSESMQFGDPSKYEFARMVAAALGYLTLSCFDKLSIAFTSEEGVSKSGIGTKLTRPIRGKSQALPYLRALAGCQCTGQGNLAASIRSLTSQKGAPGTCIIISDFLESPEFLESIKALAGSRNQIVLIQVLSPQELNPDLKGELKLIDSESGAATELTFGKARLKSYLKMLHGFFDEIKLTASKSGATYVRCQSDDDLDQFLFKRMREHAVLG